MTVLANSLSLPVMARAPIPAVDRCGRPPASSEMDANARRLAAGVARGEETAFREFYDAYYGRLFRLVFVLSRGDDSLAQDVVQAVFLVAAIICPSPDPGTMCIYAVPMLALYMVGIGVAWWVHPSRRKAKEAKETAQ